MPPLVVWLTRLQAVALVGLAVAVVVLAATSTTTLAVGFVVAEVLACLLGAWLLGWAVRWRRARSPVLLLEIIAVLVSGQLVLDGRAPVGVAVGVPALVVVVGILLAARADG